MAMLRCALVLCGAWQLVASCCGGESVAVVQDGRPRAVIVAAADDQTKQAAALLADTIEEATGARLPIADARGSHRVAIHVGLTGYVKGLGLGVEKLDDDGYVIGGVDGANVVVAGPTPWGTEFGVCELLERYVGVRWLMPGPDGTDVPTRKTVAVPLATVRHEPAFFSRLFSGLHGNAQMVWARRNRMHGRVSFHHNLIRLFPPETYVKTHPHFFPIRKGKRFLPPTNSTHGWQPCFTADGLADEAVTNICRHLDEHPDATSYSLGVNDSSGHCECERCQARDTGKPNFLGRRDVSDRYFEWCNRVVEGVVKKHPDTWFGCLAYSEVAQPPSRVKVHPRIIPYMTYDRMKWVHGELRAEGERMTKAWRAMSPVVGWYDYIYGWTYCVPRVWFHHMAGYYRFGHAHGVRALYAEAYPNWGEGPKLYVSLKLQWDPTQDVDALLRDWYVRCVGPDAAGDLAAYYALWEDFWTRRILDSKWFTPRGQYLRFSDPSYLSDVTAADVATCRQHLERVVAKAKTPKQKARARLLMLAFEYYEASAVTWAGDRMAGRVAVRNEADALKVLDQAERCLALTARRQQLVADVFPKHPYLLRPIDFDRYPQIRGAAWGSGLLWAVLDQAAESQAVRERLRAMAQSPLESARLAGSTLLTVLDPAAKPLSANPSFEEPAGKWPREWSPWVKWGVGRMTAGPRAAHDGTQGVLCTGMKRGGPHQSLAVTPGRYAAVAHVRLPTPPPAGATLTLSLTPLDDQGKNLPAIESTIRAEAGEWRRLAVAGTIPATLRKRQVKRVRLIVILNAPEPIPEVHIDDVALYRID